MSPNTPELNSTDISVIICAYTQERWDDIIEAIASVQNQSQPVGEIVLVVDHNEALLEQATKQYPQGVIITSNRHKQGLSGARNTGIESSRGSIIAFLDDDAVADSEWAAEMLKPYADEKVVGVGGAVNPIWLTNDGPGSRPDWWPEEFNWVVGCSYIGLPTKQAQIRNPIGANMSVRRVAFDAVGGFSSAIGRVGKHPVGCEETELFIRINQHWKDSKVMYQPSSSVGHKVPDARANYTYFRKRCFAEGLSKAIVSQLVGAQDGLASERTYTVKTLPLGALGGIGRGLTGKVAGFGKAGAIITGLLITTAGYLRGRLAKGPERNLVTIPTSDKKA